MYVDSSKDEVQEWFNEKYPTLANEFQGMNGEQLIDCIDCTEATFVDGLQHVAKPMVARALFRKLHSAG